LARKEELQAKALYVTFKMDYSLVIFWAGFPLCFSGSRENKIRTDGHMDTGLEQEERR
jgi:hypothetical protein